MHALRSEHATHRRPAVIRLSGYVRLPRDAHRRKITRRAVFARHPTVEGRQLGLGQHRRELRPVQPPQGRPAAPPGEHAPPHDAEGPELDDLHPRRLADHPGGVAAVAAGSRLATRRFPRRERSASLPRTQVRRRAPARRDRGQRQRRRDPRRVKRRKAPGFRLVPGAFRLLPDWNEIGAQWCARMHAPGGPIRLRVRRWPGLDSARRVQPTDLVAGHLQGPATTRTSDTDHLLSLVSERLAACDDGSRRLGGSWRTHSTAEGPTRRRERPAACPPRPRRRPAQRPPERRGR
jgi:hypothetical protein